LANKAVEAAKKLREQAHANAKRAEEAASKAIANATAKE
jgi:hypothetical protein